MDPTKRTLVQWIMAATLLVWIIPYMLWMLAGLILSDMVETQRLNNLRRDR